MQTSTKHTCTDLAVFQIVPGEGQGRVGRDKGWGLWATPKQSPRVTPAMGVGQLLLSLLCVRGPASCRMVWCEVWEAGLSGAG